MKTKEARGTVKVLDPLEHGREIADVRSFLEGYSAHTKVAEPLLEVIEKQMETLKHIRDGYDCTYVEGDRITGHQPCQHCAAREALASSAQVVAHYRSQVLGEPEK